MQKLSAISAHILTMPGVSRDQVEAFADLGRLIPTGRDLGQGIEVGRFRYDAVISIEDCPAVIASLLLSSVMIWLAENDPDRERRNLSEPEIDVTLQDEQRVFVQLSIEFDESLQIVPDPEGNLDFNGQKWRVADINIDVAEAIHSMEKG